MPGQGDLRLSIVVNNYNYARFLKDSIGSALDVRWPNKEVLVVDDGSTDDSRRVIASYDDRVVPILKDNGGQNSAANAGFAAASGDVVIFLDSDDVLFPGVGAAVMRAHHAGVAKVQYGLYKTDERGAQIGPPWPHFTERNTPQWARRMIAQTGMYDAPPTSGNAWSRRFLSQVFPLPVRRPGDASRWGRWFDVYLSMLAPFFGEVVSLCEPFGNYRIHDRNDSGGRGFTPEFIASILQEDKLRERAVNEVLARRARKLRVDWELNIHHLKHRVMLKRLMPALYPYDDGPGGLFPKLVRAALRSDATAESKLMLVAWATLMTLAPRQVAVSAAQFKQHYRTPLRELVSGALSAVRTRM